MHTTCCYDAICTCLCCCGVLRVDYSVPAWLCGVVVNWRLLKLRLVMCDTSEMENFVVLFSGFILKVNVDVSVSLWNLCLVVNFLNFVDSYIYLVHSF